MTRQIDPFSMSCSQNGSSTFVNSRYPPAPRGLVVYFIGDLHGRLDLLLNVHARIDRDKREFSTDEVTEVYVGDYIDRGPDSAAVASALIERAKKARTRFLRGNHEQLLLDFIEGHDVLEEWKAVGGAATLLSYRVPPELLKHGVAHDVVRRALSEKMPKEHRDFFKATGSYISIGPYLAVHAGVRPGISLDRQTARDLLTIRGDFLRCADDFGHIVIHGHTPVQEPDLRRNRINIDTGAFATNRLSCIRLGADGVSIVEDEGVRVAGRP